MANVSVLFVCMGNICRSPTAEGVFRHLVEEAGLGAKIHIESAGTHAFHTGHEPDRRAQAAAERRGYSLTGIRARPIDSADFQKFDYILAMDRENLAVLESQVEAEPRGQIALFLDYIDAAESEVPDPYYGGARGFERVLDLVEEASQALLDEISKQRL